MSEPTSLFTKIVAGEIPSLKVYEDALVYAFLDIGPLSRGHCLVIPKKCYVTLDQVPDETAAAIGRVLPRLARAVMKVTGATAYNVLQNNGKERRTRRWTTSTSTSSRSTQPRKRPRKRRRRGAGHRLAGGQAGPGRGAKAARRDRGGALKTNRQRHRGQ